MRFHSQFSFEQNCLQLSTAFWYMLSFFSIILRAYFLNVKFSYTVKPVYNDHLVAVVARWSLFRDHLCSKSAKWNNKMVVVVDRWSLFGVVVSSGLTVFVNSFLSIFKSNVCYFRLALPFPTICTTSAPSPWPSSS